MIKVHIPSFRKVDCEHERSYTAFCVNITTTWGRRYVVERRYTDFEELHKQLRLKSVETEQFPAKTVMKWSPKVLEHRRQGFEKYLQSLLELHKTPRCVLRFLEVDERFRDYRINSPVEMEGTHRMFATPLIGFTEDAFLHDQTRGGVGDIITSGTLLGVYGSHAPVYDDL